MGGKGGDLLGIGVIIGGEQGVGGKEAGWGRGVVCRV